MNGIGTQQPETAWRRVISVVTQPGADLGHTSVYPFVPEKAHLSRDAIRARGELVLEAHATDYQSTDAPADLAVGKWRS